MIDGLISELEAMEEPSCMMISKREGRYDRHVERLDGAMDCYMIHMP